MRPLACCIAITAFGCATPADEPAPTSAATQADTVGIGGCPVFSYGGGPLLVHARIQNIFWGSYWNGAGANMRQQIDQAWNTIGNNREFYTPLIQYGVTFGQYLGAVTYNADPAPVIDEPDIQSMLTSAMFFHLVPSDPDLQMAYIVYLPPGITSTYDANNGFQAHHSNYRSYIDNPTNGSLVSYAAVTYVAGTTTQATLDNMTLFSSHEVDEAITDPYPGGWTEVGDPCQGSPRGFRFNGYKVERVWSVADCGCVTTLAAPFPSKHDIVWWNSSNGWVSFWQMNGGTSVRTFADLAPAGLNWRIAGTGDFNGDGESDLLWYDTSSGELSTWLIRGTTVQTFGGTPRLATLQLASIAGIGDFDGDGISDVLWRNNLDGSVIIGWGGGRNGPNTSPSLAAGTDWTIQGVGDFNGDRRSDILWRNTSSGAIAIWFMNGSTQLSTPLVSSGVTPDWQVAGVGDFNGDGRADILWRNTVRGDVGEWVMNGASVTSYATVWSAVDLQWQIKTVGDLDGDGKDDIVWRHGPTGDVGVWLLNGSSVRSMTSPKAGVPPQWQIMGTSADQTF